jgi:nucleotide-binding universal stress UspA family protein
MSGRRWILVPVDIDDFGDCRGKAVAAQACAFHGQALLVHVLETDQLDRDLPTPAECLARAYLELQAMRLRVAGVQAATVLLSGPVARTITHAAVEYDAAVVVLGSRSHSLGWFAPSLGATASAVVASAPCPVLLMQPDHARPQAGLRDFTKDAGVVGATIARVAFGAGDPHSR